MPEEIPPAATDAPAAPPAVAPPVPPVAAPRVAAAPVVAPVALAQTAAPPSPKKTLRDLLGENTDDAATKRIIRAQRQALKEFGIDVDKDADIPAEAAKYKAKLDERNAERKTYRGEAESTKAQLARATSALDTVTKAEMAALPPEQQALVKATAGEDLFKQAEVLFAWKAAGLLKPAAAAPAAPIAPVVAPAAPVAPAPQAPLPPPASSAPAQPGPVQTPVPVTDRMAEWTRMKDDRDPKVNASASLYYLQNYDEINAALIRRGAT